MTKQTRALPLSKTSHVGLFLSAAFMSALALWQWLELMKVRQGGSAACSINQTLNCEKVWDTAFAAWVQSTLGLPVAAWGLVWGLGALAWAAGLCFKKNPAWLGITTWGARLWALAGTLSCALFAYVSWQAGSVCLSCMATFALVLTYAFCAFALLPLYSHLAKNSFPLASLLCLAFVLLPTALLQPLGEKTLPPPPSPLLASGDNDSAPTPAGYPSATPPSLEDFLAGLDTKTRSQLKQARAAFLAKPGRPVAAPTPGRSHRQAPVVLQDFTDIKCGHCKTAETVLAQLLRSVPEGSIAVEPRYYPLDRECHPSSVSPPLLLPDSPPKGVQCSAALAQICLEGAADFAQLRHALFHMAKLETRADVLAVASSGKTSRAQLEACMASPDALTRLYADIALAQSHGIEGTPFFLLNGKPVGLVPSFWVAMALAKGNAEHPAFDTL
ncbi:MAG: thioredoxin domain-containing protein [Cystobacterineae bacterium]|nr:thioredoxin domain-containing protein [Cystobacterineae bacterium]